MWHHHDGRGIDPKGTRGFSLPTATVHYAPDRQARVEHLKLELWVRPDTPGVRGTVRLALFPLRPARTLTLDAAELTIERVLGPNGPLPFVIEGSRLVVTFPDLLAPEAKVDLTIDYRGEPRRGLYFIHPSEARPHLPAEVWTQGQDDDSRHWFPCFDGPHEKAPSELIAHVPAGLFALSNGELVEKREEGAEWVWHYRQAEPHSTYLVTLVVGRYVPIEDQAGEVPVVSYVHPEQLAAGRLTFARTGQMVRHFAERIGLPYPWARYSQICVADFIFGGMENTSATTLTDQVLFDARSEADYRAQAESLIAHELAHQWWGDLVTCHDWSHAWLNEGFATYFELIWREHADGADDAAYARLLDKEAYLQEGYRRPLVERCFEEPIELFDRHQYEKGALVLHLIRTTLGDEAFFRSLRLYAERHRHGTVESQDLYRAIEAATGRNLQALFDQWVYAAGHPVLNISGAYDEVNRCFNLTVEQVQKGERIPEAFTFSCEVEIRTEVGVERHPVHLEHKKQTVRIPVEGRPKAVIFDRGGHLPKQVDNRLPPHLLRGVLEASDDPIAVIEAARALVGRGDPASVQAVLDCLRDHNFWGVRAECAKALRRLPIQSVKECLTDAVLEDGDPRVRRAAIRALGAFYDDREEVAEFLIRHAPIERSDYVLADTCRTLAELRASTARAFLEANLERDSHNDCLRAAAAEGLAKLREPELLPKLYERLGPEHHPKLREAATYGIAGLARLLPVGSAPRVEAGEQLERLLDDPWLRVRIRAAEALKSLGEPRAASALEERIPRELDGRARRAMRLAERDLKKHPPLGEELDRLRDELKRLELDHGKLKERLEKVELTRRAPPPAPAKKEKKKKKKKHL
ncbi:MAG: HEAT repeat domain-containing protein [Deltaproteobacteria bacterium]|nr:HEAT repeat domain-containing protein [Deltaproteobacteria bacterium]